jgi:4-amino-4-deoxy-L-arabinose transferase-like glycosyltransferase
VTAAVDSLLERRLTTTPESEPEKRCMFLVILAILIIAGLLRLFYVNTVVVDAPIRADARKYTILGYNLASKGVYSLSLSEPLRPTRYITPGYPLFLALLFKVAGGLEAFYLLVLNSQAIVSTLTVLLVYYLGLKLASCRTAIFASILAAISPHSIVSTGYVLTESLFTFLLTLSVVLGVEALDRESMLLMAVCGLTLAAAALVRPALLLFPTAIFLVAWRKQGLKAAGFTILAMLIAFSVIWSPWQIWKIRHDAGPEPSLLACAVALGGYPNLIYKSPELAGFPYCEDPEYPAMKKNVHRAVSVIGSRAKDEPIKYLRWYFFGKPVMFWSPSIVAGEGGPFIYHVNNSLYHELPIFALTLQSMMLLHPCMAMLAAIACVIAAGEFLKEKSCSGPRICRYIIALLCLYFTAVHTVLAPLPRYAYPVHAFAYLLACWMLDCLFRRLQTMRWNRHA